MISTKGRYALRMMIDIALHSSDNPVRIKDIAERQEISDKYLEQIVSTLNKAGLLSSTRGPMGGYRLVKPASQYTVGEILRCTEGSLAPVACLDGPWSGCEKKHLCYTLPLWKKLDEAVNGVIDNTSLQDLLDWNSDNNNYVI